MKKAPFLSRGSAFIFLLFIFIFCGRGAYAGAEYKLEAPSAVNLPSCRSGDTVSGAFNISNGSASPVFLYVYSSCVCLKASPDTMPLGAGESAAVAFIFNTEKMSGLHTKDIIFKTVPGGPVSLAVPVNIIIKPPDGRKSSDTDNERLITIHVFDAPKGILAGRISEMLSGDICTGPYRLSCSAYNIRSPYAAKLADKFFAASGGKIPEAPFMIIGENFYPAGINLKQNICEGVAAWKGDLIEKLK